MSLSNFSPSAHNPNATKLQWLCYKKLQLPATDIITLSMNCPQVDSAWALGSRKQPPQQTAARRPQPRREPRKPQQPQNPKKGGEKNRTNHHAEPTTRSTNETTEPRYAPGSRATNCTNEPIAPQVTSSRRNAKKAKQHAKQQAKPCYLQSSHNKRLSRLRELWHMW
jgi:hypothetical protein